MKIPHLAIIVIIFVLIVCAYNNLTFAQNYTSISGLSQTSNIPVIMTQIELNSPYKLIPENTSCSQWNETTKSGPFCLANIVPNRGVECSIFIGSASCEPIHVEDIINPCDVGDGFFSNGTVVKDVMHEYGEQWVTLYNRLDAPVIVSHFEISPNEDWRNGGYYGPTLPYHIANTPDIAPYLAMKSHQSCTYGFYAVDEPLTIDPDNSTLTILYMYNGTQYQSSTPPLTDDYSDMKTWQFDGNKWVFTEQNTISIPEFQFTIPILLIGMTSLIIFYKIKIGI